MSEIKVLLFGLPNSCTWGRIKDICKSQNLHVAFVSNITNGDGFIKFKSMQEAIAAAKLFNGNVIDGKTVSARVEGDFHAKPARATSVTSTRQEEPRERHHRGKHERVRNGEEETGDTSDLLLSLMKDTGSPALTVQVSLPSVVLKGTVEEVFSKVHEHLEKTNQLSTKIEAQFLDIPKNKLKVIIGPEGDTVRYIQDVSGASVQIPKESAVVTIKGAYAYTRVAAELIEQLLTPQHSALFKKIFKRTETPAEVIEKRGQLIIKRLEQQYDAKKLDLIICMDCTGSMGPYIRQVKEKIAWIVEEVEAKSKLLYKQTAQKIDVAVGMVCYRDHMDVKSIEVHPLDANLSSFNEFIAKIEATGGGDAPEAVSLGFKEITKMKFRKNSTRIAIWVGDAPCHGLDLSIHDQFPNGDKDDPLQLARTLISNYGVSIYSVAVEPSVGHYTTTREFYKAVAEITGGRFISLFDTSILPRIIVAACMDEIEVLPTISMIEKIILQNKSFDRIVNNYAAELGSDEAQDDLLLDEVADRISSILRDQKVLSTHYQMKGVFMFYPHVKIITYAPSLAEVRKLVPMAKVTEAFYPKRRTLTQIQSIKKLEREIKTPKTEHVKIQGNHFEVVKEPISPEQVRRLLLKRKFYSNDLNWQ